MTAVIWTDVVQMFIYIGGTFVALITLGSHIPGGWHTIHMVAGAAGKFHMLDFAFNLTNSYTFWAGHSGRDVPHHGLARHRPTDGAAHAGRAQSA